MPRASLRAVAAGPSMCVYACVLRFVVQHVIKAPTAGTVGAVHFAVGEFVEDGRELVAFKV